MQNSGSNEPPLVSIVTPVYNGASYLDQCIQSVRQQTYQNWEYVIVNNCSTDGTAEIAERHAQEDGRIRVAHNATFLSLIANWNHALRSISANSRYCKVIHADDLLIDDCLEKMVEVAERHPSVGIVGAYVRKGSRVVGDEFPFPNELRSGRVVAKETLQKRYYVFGSPSSILLRADLVRKRDPFYNESNFHADVEVCFDILRKADFGFVHKVLTYTREHSSSQTSTVADRLKTNLIENQFGMLVRYGPELLDEMELRQRMDGIIKRYYWQLARDLGSLLSARFRKHQRVMLRRQGLRFQWGKLVKALVGRATRAVSRPRALAQRIFRLVGYEVTR